MFKPVTLQYTLSPFHFGLLHWIIVPNYNTNMKLNLLHFHSNLQTKFCTLNYIFRSTFLQCVPKLHIELPCAKYFAISIKVPICFCKWFHPVHVLLNVLSFNDLSLCLMYCRVSNHSTHRHLTTFPRWFLNHNSLSDVMKSVSPFLKDKTEEFHKEILKGMFVIYHNSELSVTLNTERVLQKMTLMDYMM